MSKEVLGRKCFTRLQDIQPPVDAALLLTSPEVTDVVVQNVNAEFGVSGCTGPVVRGQLATQQSSFAASVRSKTERTTSIPLETPELVRDKSLECTVTRFRLLTPLECAVTKKGGGLGPRRTRSPSTTLTISSSCYIRRWTCPMKSVEWQGYGKTHISWRGGMRYRIEISGRGGGQKAAGGLRAVSGRERAERAQLQATACGSQDDRLRRADARAPG